LIARQDPVFYGQWQPSAPLTKAQTAKFNQDGYLLLEDVFTADEVLYMQAEAKHTLQNAATLRQETVISEFASYDVRSIFAIHQQSQLMGRLASDQRLVEVASFLLALAWMMMFVCISHDSTISLALLAKSSIVTLILKHGIRKMVCHVCALYRCRCC